MRRVNLLVILASFLLIVAVAATFYYLGERNAALEMASGTREAASMPFSLTGGGVALGIAGWFIRKILLVITTVFKLVIGFLLLLAAGMAVATLTL